jgi:hypothetical protein
MQMIWLFFLSPFQGCKICLMLYMNIHLNGHLSVSTSKTKIVVFRNGGKMNVNEKRLTTINKCHFAIIDI